MNGCCAATPPSHDDACLWYWPCGCQKFYSDWVGRKVMPHTHRAGKRKRKS